MTCKTLIGIQKLQYSADLFSDFARGSAELSGESLAEMGDVLESGFVCCFSNGDAGIAKQLSGLLKPNGKKILVRCGAGL